VWALALAGVDSFHFAASAFLELVAAFSGGSDE
jgi:hypothetical protein